MTFYQRLGLRIIDLGLWLFGLDRTAKQHSQVASALYDFERERYDKENPGWREGPYR